MIVDFTHTDADFLSLAAGEGTGAATGRSEHDGGEAFAAIFEPLSVGSEPAEGPPSGPSDDSGSAQDPTHAVHPGTPQTPSTTPLEEPGGSADQPVALPNGVGLQTAGEAELTPEYLLTATAAGVDKSGNVLPVGGNTALANVGPSPLIASADPGVTGVGNGLPVDELVPLSNSTAGPRPVDATAATVSLQANVAPAMTIRPGALEGGGVDAARVSDIFTGVERELIDLGRKLGIESAARSQAGDTDLAKLSDIFTGVERQLTDLGRKLGTETAARAQLGDIDAARLSDSFTGVERQLTDLGRRLGIESAAGSQADDANAGRFSDFFTGVGRQLAELGRRLGIEPAVRPQVGELPGSSLLPGQGQPAEPGFALERSPLPFDVELNPGIRPTSERALTETPLDARSPRIAMQQFAGQPGWGEELRGHVQWLSRQGSHRAELQLHPAELGSIDVRITSENDQTSVVFLAANRSARELLEAELPRLREMFAQAGIELGETQVSDRDQNDSGLAARDDGYDGDHITGVKDPAESADNTPEGVTSPSGGADNTRSVIDHYI